MPMLLVVIVLDLFELVAFCPFSSDLSEPLEATTWGTSELLPGISSLITDFDGFLAEAILSDGDLASPTVEGIVRLLGNILLESRELGVEVGNWLLRALGLELVVVLGIREGFGSFWLIGPISAILLGLGLTATGEL
jgi:hypothetical protein